MYTDAFDPYKCEETCQLQEIFAANKQIKCWATRVVII